MRTALIVPAAGQGERLGAGKPKAFVELAGESLLRHAVRGAAQSGVIDAVVVAVPDGFGDTAAGALAGVAGPVAVVPGGASRTESVGRALAAVPGDIESVLVHDAARALTPPGVFVAVVDALAAGADVVVPAVAVTDTIKEVSVDVVVSTPDRAALRAVQTPQGLRIELARRAHAEITDAVTDDAGMAERLGYKVRVVPGHREAFKITEPLDLVLAEAILARREGRA